MPANVEHRYTYDDYTKLPEGAPYQLIDGELVHDPAPIPLHQRISRRLLVALSNFVDSNGLGEVFDAPIDVYFSEFDTFQPDIIYIDRKRLEIIGAKKIDGAPDLVMEILSPSTKRHDLGKKKAMYQASGVQEFWIVDPVVQSVEVLQNNGTRFERAAFVSREGEICSTLLKGFSLHAETLFA